MIWQAGRIAHAVLGLGAVDERDPLEVNRKAALKALAYQFLNLAKRNHIRVVVRLKDLQPGDCHALCLILAQCFDTQLDQVFESLDESQRSEALGLLAQQIGDRYHD